MLFKYFFLKKQVENAKHLKTLIFACFTFFFTLVKYAAYPTLYLKLSNYRNPLFSTGLTILNHTPGPFFLISKH